MRNIECIVIHHSASSRNTTFEQIRHWHMYGREDPFDDIGYHFVIGPGGGVHRGRTIDVIGAHVLGYNEHTLGICVTGDNTKKEDRWNQSQKDGLIKLIGSLHIVLGYIPVERHSELAPTKCPGLDGPAWYDLMKPLNLHGEQ
jgi:hypothetical protein